MKTEESKRYRMNRRRSENYVRLNGDGGTLSSVSGATSTSSLSCEPGMDDFCDTSLTVHFNNEEIKKETALPSEIVDDVNYIKNRNMTPLQERFNAITILPSTFFCLYYLLSGRWLSPEGIDNAREALPEGAEKANAVPGADDTLINRCLDSPLFPHMHGMPPLTLVAIVLGITLHCPCSFLYHWKYATSLPPGLPRIEHWSRRLDHSAIHVCSALWSYGTSGSVRYFIVNVAYNLDCIFKHFEPQIRPLRNQIRIVLSMLAYTAPLLKRDVILFGWVWFLFGMAIWCFRSYPLGGWSHSAFHLIMMLVPPLLLQSARLLPASSDLIDVAARCAVLKEYH